MISICFYLITKKYSLLVVKKSGNRKPYPW